ncbi:MAG: hypothetical protein E6I89_11055 [Chloroflexi bacterium]|nr:MAG: hypothetical protein E6I89_11055 [Chloroflexota bacterium]
MSQMPPPPPGQPAPMPGPMPGASNPVGTNKKTYSVLAYLVGWLTGIIFLFVGKDDPDVKWNAANSIVIFGGLSIIMFIFSFIPFIHFLVYPLWLIGFVYWLVFLVQGLQGTGQRLPAPVIGTYINTYVDQLANSVK